MFGWGWVDLWFSWCFDNRQDLISQSEFPNCQIKLTDDMEYKYYGILMPNLLDMQLLENAQIMI